MVSMMDVSNLIRLGDFCVVFYAVYKAIRLFEDRRVIRKYRTFGACCDLMCAIGAMLILSKNLFINSIGVIVIIIVSFLALKDHWKEQAMRRKSKANSIHWDKLNKDIKDLNKVNDNIEKSFKHMMRTDSSFRKAEEEREKRYKTDPKFRAKVDKQRAITYNNLIHGRKDPKLEHDRARMAKMAKVLKDTLKKVDIKQKSLHDTLKAYPELKKPYDKFKHRFKNDPDFKESVSNEHGQGWQEFKPFKEELEAKMKPFAKKRFAKLKKTIISKIDKV